MVTYVSTVSWCQRPPHHCKPRPMAGTLLRMRRRQPSAPRRTAARRRWSYRRPLLLPWFRWSVNNRLSRDDDRLRKKTSFTSLIVTLFCRRTSSGDSVGPCCMGAHMQQCWLTHVFFGGKSSESVQCAIWPMSAHASQAFSIAHCTDSEDLPLWVHDNFPCPQPPLHNLQQKPSTPLYTA